MNAIPPTFGRVAALALAVGDFSRAMRFYTDILSLLPAYEGGELVGVKAGDTFLLFKQDWYAQPSASLNPRVTLKTGDARGLEAMLRARGVTITDPVEAYGESFIGSFLDSEGNKLWFCSDAEGA